MDHATVVSLLNRRRAALDSKDMVALAELFSSSARLQSPLSGASSGPVAIAAATEAFYSAFPDAIITEEPPIIDGTRVAILAEVAGTHRGVFMGLEPTGHPFRFPVVFLLEFDDGRIVFERRLYDFTGLLLQVGVLRAKPV
jgi:predicted ester cyclase